MITIDNKRAGATDLAGELLCLVRDIRLAFRWKMGEYSGMNMKMPDREPRVVAIVPEPACVTSAVTNAQTSAKCLCDNANSLIGVLQQLGNELSTSGNPATMSYSEIGTSGIEWDCEKVNAFRRKSEQYLYLLGCDVAAMHENKRKLFDCFTLRHVCSDDPSDMSETSGPPGVRHEPDRAESEQTKSRKKQSG